MEVLVVFGLIPQELAAQAAAGAVILGTRGGLPCVGKPGRIT